MSNNPAPVCKPAVADAVLPEIALPFKKGVEVTCTHSAEEGSHSWPNAFYALDLATPYDQPAPDILASESGKAFVFLGEDGKPCPQYGSAQYSKIDDCGSGWGNSVKILHQGGYASFYVHLDKVTVKNGQSVRRGQKIGTMGWTGLAGHRHLHWSVQKMPGFSLAEWESKMFWDGQSVPFKFVALQDGEKKTFDTRTLLCPHANLGQIPGLVQPKFIGL